MKTLKAPWFWLLALMVVAITVLAALGKVGGSEAVAAMGGYVGGLLNSLLKKKEVSDG